MDRIRHGNRGNMIMWRILGVDHEVFENVVAGHWAHGMDINDNILHEPLNANIDLNPWAVVPRPTLWTPCERFRMAPKFVDDTRRYTVVAVDQAIQSESIRIIRPETKRTSSSRDDSRSSPPASTITRPLRTTNSNSKSLPETSAATTSYHETTLMKDIRREWLESHVVRSKLGIRRKICGRGKRRDRCEHVASGDSKSSKSEDCSSIEWSGRMLKNQTPSRDGGG